MLVPKTEFAKRALKASSVSNYAMFIALAFSSVSLALWAVVSPFDYGHALFTLFILIAGLTVIATVSALYMNGAVRACEEEGEIVRAPKPPGNS